jgi:hypothetical protein
MKLGTNIRTHLRTKREEKKKSKHDNIYRLKNISISEICDKYPDMVADVWTENGVAVIQLEHVRIKYVNTQQPLITNYRGPEVTA